MRWLEDDNLFGFILIFCGFTHMLEEALFTQPAS